MPTSSMPSWSIRWTGAAVSEGLQGDGVVAVNGDGTAGDTLAGLADWGTALRGPVADLFGDHREEIAGHGPNYQGLKIFVNTGESDMRKPTLLQDRLYRLGMASSLGAGYYTNLQLSGQSLPPQYVLPATIRGSVIDDSGDEIAGVELSASGSFDIARRGFSYGDGSFTLSGIPEHGTFTVTPRKAGFGFEPAQQQVTTTTGDPAQLSFVGTWQLAVAPEIQQSTCKPFTYELAYVDVGSSYYLDRSYVITHIPAAYQDKVWLKTAIQDRQCQGDPLITLTATSVVDIHIGHGDGAALPAWLESWTDTGDVITADCHPHGEASYRLYERQFQPGPIELGPTTATATNMYIVLVD